MKKKYFLWKFVSLKCNRMHEHSKPKSLKCFVCVKFVIGKSGKMLECEEIECLSIQSLFLVH